jgi:hypothetical protein
MEQPEGWFVAVALEVDEEHPVADVEYRGTQVAAVRGVPSGCEVVLYEAEGVPLDGLISALQWARAQLRS